MNRNLILLSLLILTLIPFTYAANDFAFNRLYTDGQIIDGLNYSINVNSSENWITNIGSLSGVNDSQFSNEGGILTAIKSWWDGLYCELTGCTMQGDINMDGNNILDVGNLEVNENITARGTFIHFPNAGMLIGSEINESTLFAGEGDLIIQGDFISNKSVNIINKQFGSGLGVVASGAPGRSKLFLTGTGTYNNSTKEFCDTFNSPFNSSFLFNRLDGIFTLPVNIGFSSEIISIINSSCVIINTPISGGQSLPSLNTIFYITGDAPLLQVMDGGSFSASVGNDPLAGFRVNFLNATGETNFIITTIAGDNDVIASSIDSDSKGYNNIINLLSSIKSSEEIDGTIQKNIVGSADLNNYTDGQYTGISLEILGEGINISKTALDISSQFDTIINIAQEEKITRSYYDNVSAITDITSQLNNTASSTTLFESNGSVLYIGNVINFTSISFSLDVESFNSIIPTFFYCNSSSEWESFTPLDGTSGFTHSGTISFENPIDRGICNIELDGTPFIDVINHTYIAIQRTEPILPTTPSVKTAQLFIKSSEIIYGNPEGVVGADRTLSISNEADLEEGEPSFLVVSKDSSGQRRINFALVSRQNESGGINYNSLGLFPDNDLSGQDKLNLTKLTNIISRWGNYGINPLTDYFSQENRTSLAVLYAIESQGLLLHDDIGNGKLLGEGEFSWVNRIGFAAKFLNGDGVLISKDVIKEFGFSAGDNIISLNAKFETGTLSPFTQTTGGGANDWSLISSISCHSGVCASAEGGSGSPLRSMQANFSSIDQNNINLSWWITTIQSSPDVFSVDVNNNVGSGDVTVFTSSATFADEFQSVILPSTMDNKSIVSVTFNFQGNNQNTDVVYIDAVLVVGNATTTTLANVTVEDGELNFGDKTCGILLSAEDGYQDLNITCDNINFIGNVSSVNVTEISINVTTNVSIGDTIFVDNIRELTTDNGIIMWNNVGMGNNSIYNLNDLNLSGNINLGGDILPLVTNGNDIGSEDLQIGNIYLSGNIQSHGAYVEEAKVGVALIDKGAIVYIINASGNKPTVGLADNTVHDGSHIYGMAIETATLGQTIHIAILGEIDGLDTSMFSEGDLLHLTTNGTYQTAIPSNGSHIHVGRVTKSNAGAGIIKLIIDQYTHDIQGTTDSNVSLGGNKIEFQNYTQSNIGFMDMISNIFSWDGNFGIGVTDPDTELEVNGGIHVGDLEGSYSGGSAYVCVYNNGTLFASESACP